MLILYWILSSVVVVIVNIAPQEVGRHSGYGFDYAFVLFLKILPDSKKDLRLLNVGLACTLTPEIKLK